MIYWKNTAQFGYPAPDDTVSIVYQDGIEEAYIEAAPTGNRWQRIVEWRYDPKKQERYAITIIMDLDMVSYWSETNLPR